MPKKGQNVFESFCYMLNRGARQGKQKKDRALLNFLYVSWNVLLIWNRPILHREVLAIKGHSEIKLVGLFVALKACGLGYSNWCLPLPVHYFSIEPSQIF